ncbi:MAG: AAA family ATPase, partial [Bellilinea sp.]
MILIESISNRIKEQKSILEENGEILPDEKLAEYYQLFKQTFGPEKLMSMDGEILLSTMHDTRNRDSLVYWLEFKNDEQMPNRFGSIAGGS